MARQSVPHEIADLYLPGQEELALMAALPIELELESDEDATRRRELVAVGLRDRGLLSFLWAPQSVPSRVEAVLTEWGAAVFRAAVEGRAERHG